MGVPLSADKTAVQGVKGASSVNIITAKDISNGHCEKTLALLWAIMFHCKMPSLVNVPRLRKEISVLRACYAKVDDIMARLQAEDADSGVSADESQPTYWLLHWARAVCAKYGVEVRDFSASLADGRALCLLVHHYQPDLLPRKKIMPVTSELLSSKAAKGKDPKKIAESGLMGERSNFRLVKSRALALGCIPFLGTYLH